MPITESFTGKGKGVENCHDWLKLASVYALCMCMHTELRKDPGSLKAEECPNMIRGPLERKKGKTELSGK